MAMDGGWNTRIKPRVLQVGEGSRLSLLAGQASRKVLIVGLTLLLKKRVVLDGIEHYRTTKNGWSVTIYTEVSCHIY